MRSPLLTLVAGPPGSGKTAWICQQLKTAGKPAAYLNLGAGTMQLDATYLAAEVPDLSLWDEADFMNLGSADLAQPLYVELAFQIDPSALSLPGVRAVRRVAVLPPGAIQTEWHDWAEEVVAGADGLSRVEAQSFDLWRSPLTKQVLDPASLDTFWFELTHGAYGTVLRAKGIFDVADGRAFHFSFVNRAAVISATPIEPPLPLGNPPDTDYTELNLPRWLEGRPDRFSGIEVLGTGLDRAALAQTLKDCCLDDQAIAYYQQQLKNSLA
ncbi:MAG: GTP-binding protein [Cyanobacteriota bacterium]